MHNDYQRLCDIIAILVSKLGGDVTITIAEMENPPTVVQITDNINNSLEFKIDK